MTCTDGSLHLTVGLHNVVEMGKEKEEEKEEQKEEEEEKEEEEKKGQEEDGPPVAHQAMIVSGWNLFFCQRCNACK